MKSTSPAPDRAFKRPESVLVVVHDTDDRILLLKRADIRDFWQSVTGSLQWGEAAPAAAARELTEETGIDAGARLVDWHHTARFEILAQFAYRYRPGTRHNVEHMFSIQVPRDQAVVRDPGEHVAEIWLPAEQAMAQVWSWSNREAIAMVAGVASVGGG